MYQTPYSKGVQSDSLEWDYFEMPYENASAEHWKIEKDGQSLNPVELVPGEVSTDANDC